MTWVVRIPEEGYESQPKATKDAAERWRDECIAALATVEAGLAHPGRTFIVERSRKVLYPRSLHLRVARPKTEPAALVIEQWVGAPGETGHEVTMEMPLAELAAALKPFLETPS